MQNKLVMIILFSLLLALSGCSAVNPEPIRPYLYHTYLFKQNMYLYEYDAGLAGTGYILGVNDDRHKIVAVLPKGTRFQLLGMSTRAISGLVDIKVKILDGPLAGKVESMLEMSSGAFFAKANKI